MIRDNVGRGRVGRRKRQFIYLCVTAIVISVVLLVKLKPTIRKDEVSANLPVVNDEDSTWHARNSDSLFQISERPSDKLTVSGEGSELKVEVVDVDDEVENKTSHENNVVPDSGTKPASKSVILMWTNYYEVGGDLLKKLIMTGRKYDKGCCEGVEVTLDKKELANATAIVVFSYTDNLGKQFKYDYPKTRREDQLWVLFAKEGPYLTPNLAPYNNIFNWTMSYRMDSTIWAPYGLKVELDQELQPEESIIINGKSLDEWISGKSKLLAGVISHCRTSSKREEYAKRLRNETSIQVDIYGGCGIKICDRRNPSCNHAAWWLDLASKYKFYFAAENSLCHDYITEKFWRGLELGMVPVVYGDGNYSIEAPPHSFIDTRDFPTRKELADYLIHLDNTPEEYRKYFEWRRKYGVRKDESWQGWCDLCNSVKEYRKKLDENPERLSELSHVYKDLQKWWSHKPPPNEKKMACRKPEFK